MPFVEWRRQNARAGPASGVGGLVEVRVIGCGRCCTAPRGVPQSDRFKRLRSPCGGCGLPSPHPTFDRFEFQGAVPVFRNCAARLHPSSACWGVDGGRRGRHAALPGRNRHYVCPAGAHSRAVHRAFDEVTLPVPGQRALVHLGRAHVDAEHVGDLASAVVAGVARPARVLGLAQALDEFAAQLAGRLGVDRRVDGLVADVHVGLVREHAAQCGADLLGRPLAAQARLEDEPQRLQGMQLGPGALLNAALRGLSLGSVSRVALRADIAPTLAAEGRGAAPEHLGDIAQALVLKAECGERHALFGLQLSIAWAGHSVTLPAGLVLHFRFETAAYPPTSPIPDCAHRLCDSPVNIPCQARELSLKVLRWKLKLLYRLLFACWERAVYLGNFLCEPACFNHIHKWTFQFNDVHIRSVIHQ